MSPVFPFLIAPLIYIGIYAILTKFFPGSLYQFKPIATEVPKRTIVGIILLFILLLVVTNTFLISPISLNSADTVLANLQHNYIAILKRLVGFALDIGFILFCMKKLNLSWRDIGWRITSWPRILIWAGIASALVIYGYILMLTGQEPFFFSGPLTGANWITLIFSLFLTAVYPAFFEEIVLRGIFFTMFRSRYSPLVAWILQAVVFGFAHIHLQSPLGAIAPGLNFGLGMIGAGSLIPGIFSHMMLNSTGAFHDFGDYLLEYRSH